MPISRQVRITRTAISPRLAIRTFRNTQTSVADLLFSSTRLLKTLMFDREFNRLARRALRRRSIRPTPSSSSEARRRRARGSSRSRTFRARVAGRLDRTVGVADPVRRCCVRLLFRPTSRPAQLQLVVAAGGASARDRPRAAERTARGAQVAERPGRWARQDRRTAGRGRRPTGGDWRRRGHRREPHARGTTRMSLRRRCAPRRASPSSRTRCSTSVLEEIDTRRELLDERRAVGLALRERVRRARSRPLANACGSTQTDGVMTVARVGWTTPGRLPSRWMATSWSSSVGDVVHVRAHEVARR